MRATTD